MQSLQAVQLQCLVTLLYYFKLVANVMNVKKTVISTFVHVKYKLPDYKLLPNDAFKWIVLSFSMARG